MRPKWMKVSMKLNGSGRKIIIPSEKETSSLIDRDISELRVPDTQLLIWKKLFISSWFVHTV